MHIVLIEDDEIDSAAVRRIVAERPHLGPLTLIDNGSTAQMALAGSLGQRLCCEPHLILLDLHLPGLDGLSLLQWLRREPPLRGLLVYILTVSQAPADIERAYQALAAGYIIKAHTGDGFGKLGPLLDVYAQAITFVPPSDPWRRSAPGATPGKPSPPA